MPVPIFDQPVIESPEEKEEEVQRAKERISGWAVFLSLLLVAVLVIAGEFAFRDSNRLFNPYYSSCRVESSKSVFPYLFSQGAVSQSCELKKYEQTRLLLHADVAVPLIVISVLVYFFVRGKRLAGQGKVLLYAYLIFVLWMAVRIIYETEYFLLKHNDLVGKYVVLLSVAIIVSYLVVLIQKKFRSKVEKELS